LPQKACKKPDAAHPTTYSEVALQTPTAVAAAQYHCPLREAYKRMGTPRVGTLLQAVRAITNA
jgi:hypothetical protein